MITGEVYPGEDAEILVEAIKNDYSGEDIDGITNPIVFVKHYKKAHVQAVGATAIYNSALGQYLVTIPAVYVPASGTFDFVLKGDDIADVLGRLQVNTGDAVLSSIKSITDNLTLLDIESVVRTALETYGTASANDVMSAINDIKGVDWTPTNTLRTISTNVDNIGSNVVLIKTSTDKITPDSIFAKTSEAMSVYGVPTKLEIDDSFSQVKGVGWTATDSLKSIKDVQTSLISTIDWSMIKKCLIMEIGNYTLPAGGGAGTYTISLAGVGTATFTVDSKGDRTLNNITLV